MNTPNISSSSTDGRMRSLANNFSSNSMESVAKDSADLLGHADSGFFGRLWKVPNPGKTFSSFLLILALIALGISCYLSYTTFTSSPIAGCGEGGVFDCSSVQKSKYSKWLGIPVSALAAVNYLIMVIGLVSVTFFAPSRRVQTINWTVITVAGLSAGMAALWFIGLQRLVLGTYCHWCLIAHACGLIIAAALLIRRPVSSGTIFAAGGVAVCGIAGLVIGQISAEDPVPYRFVEHQAVNPSESESEEELEDFFAPPLDEDGSMFEAPTDSDEDEAENVPTANDSVSFDLNLLELLWPTAIVAYQSSGTEQTESTKQDKQGSSSAKQEGSDSKTDSKPKDRQIRLQGNIKINPKHWPVFGKPDAKYLFVEMFDYSCPHCRETHKAIKGAFERMGDELGIVVLPVPLNSNCNTAVTQTGAQFVESCETAKLAVACWRKDPEKFQEFHNWMFQDGPAPTYANALNKAYELIGQAEIDAELKREAPKKYIDKHVLLYKRAGRGVVPKLLFPLTTVEGSFTDPDGLTRLIREHAID